MSTKRNSALTAAVYLRQDSLSEPSSLFRLVVNSELTFLYSNRLKGCYAYGVPESEPSSVGRLRVSKKEAVVIPGRLIG